MPVEQLKSRTLLSCLRAHPLSPVGLGVYKSIVLLNLPGNKAVLYYLSPLDLNILSLQQLLRAASNAKAK